MSKWVAKTNIEKIMMLGINMEVNLGGRSTYRIKVAGKMEENTFFIQIIGDEPEVRGVEKGTIEMKGTVDVEYLHYKGNISVMRVLGKKDFLALHVLDLARQNVRGATRVPYCQNIKMVEPKMESCYLSNISTSGALLLLPEPLQSDEFTFQLKINKRFITLKAKLVAQEKKDDKIFYQTRCYFIDLEPSTQKLIHRLVIQIKKQAKNRLRGLIAK